VGGREFAVKLKTAMTKNEFDQKLKEPVFKKQVTEAIKNNQSRQVQNTYKRKL
jgi:hypothetical protein